MKRLAARQAVRPEARERKAKPNRVAHFLAITVGSGVIAALLAVVIAAGQAMVAAARPTDPPPRIAAGTLFPAVPPVHKVVDVYDPAPPPPPVQRPTAEPTAEPTRTPHPTPSGHPTPSAHPTPSPDN
jgi:hypothetical protein